MCAFSQLGYGTKANDTCTSKVVLVFSNIQTDLSLVGTPSTLDEHEKKRNESDSSRDEMKGTKEGQHNLHLHGG